MGKSERELLLIAMSGVRVKDKQLLELGMTLPGFVERSRVIASLPSLSLLTVAAYTPEHWNVRYCEIDELSECELSAIKDCDLVGISAYTARIVDAYTVADAIRLQGIPVVIGGLHASVLPQEAQQHADAVVVGEAELVWEELIRDFENQRLRSRYDAKSEHLVFDMATSKVPRYDLLDVDKYNRITLQTSRGCPLDCTFCAASRLLARYTVKPLHRIKAELEAILSIWPRPFIELADDNTFLNKKWGRELAYLLGQYPIKWFTETDISVADDEELLELLARSGCAQLLIGFESSVPESLRGIDAKDWKYRQYDSYLSKIDIIQSYGISVNGCFVLGFDTDDSSVFQATRDFVFASSLAEVQITILTPFPGTELYASLAAEERLLEPVYWDKCTLFDVTYQPKLMSVEELTSGFRELMRTLYTDEQHKKRRRSFRQCVKNRKSYSLR